MKNCFLFTLLVSFIFNLNAQTKHIVIVDSDFFNPANINITLGDTVMWQWQSGIHTTTSDASSGPDSWNAQISFNSQTFNFVISSEGLHRYYCIPHGGPNGVGMSGTITVSGITSADDEINSPLTFQLEQNYPNPFNPSTNITYRIGTSGIVKLVVYNSLGNEIETLINEYKNSGIYTYTFNAKNLASGLYFYKLTAGNLYETRKMLLIK